MSATLDLPPADNSAMDGYAIRHADFQPDVVLPIQQRCYAGDMPQPQLPGQATRLFTGSLIPPGADTVVMQENTREADGQVQILQAPPAGQFVRKRGLDTTDWKSTRPNSSQESASRMPTSACKINTQQKSGLIILKVLSNTMHMNQL